MSSAAKRLKTLSNKELSGIPPEPTTVKPCIVVDHTQTLLTIREDLGRVTSRLDALQASIDHLLGICLQEEQDDSFAVEEQ